MHDESLSLMTVAVLPWNWALSSICWQGWSSLLSVGGRSFWRAFSLETLKKKKPLHFWGPCFSMQALVPSAKGVCVYVCVCVLSRFSHVWLFGTPWTVACQALLSVGFSRQEYWSGLPFPSPGGLPNPGIESRSLTSPALADRFFTTSATWETYLEIVNSTLDTTLSFYINVMFSI